MSPYSSPVDRTGWVGGGEGGREGPQKERERGGGRAKQRERGREREFKIEREREREGVRE